MIAFPMMLEEPAKQAGISIPEDSEDFSPEEYPHFAVYLNAQLGSPLPSPDSHWQNARVVARISNKKIKEITAEDLLELGWSG